jgi:hypothetical protein
MAAAMTHLRNIAMDTCMLIIEAPMHYKAITILVIIAEPMSAQAKGGCWILHSILFVGCLALFVDTFGMLSLKREKIFRAVLAFVVCLLHGPANKGTTKGKTTKNNNRRRTN